MKFVVHKCLLLVVEANGYEDVVEYDLNNSTKSGSRLPKQRNALDSYPFLPIEGIYIANQRFRDLVDNVGDFASRTSPSILSTTQPLRRTIYGLHTFSSIFNVQESFSTQPLLDAFLHNIKVMAETSGLRIQNVKRRQVQEILQNMPLSGANTEPEPCLSTKVANMTWICLVSEAKTPAASLLAALLQGCALGGDAAICQRIQGLNCSSCAVPIVLCASEFIQIAGAYLVEESVPVFCMLSRPLNRLLDKDLHELVVWQNCLADFIVQTVKLCKDAKRNTGTKRAPALNLTRYFLKPIRYEHMDIFGEPNLNPENAQKAEKFTTNHRCVVNRMLQVYEKLRKNTRVASYISMPVGMLQLPSNENSKNYKQMVARIEKCFENHSLRDGDTKPLTPLMVYEFLEGWKNMSDSIQELGTDENLGSLIIKKIREVINLCNLEGVVFLDLRPANIMWREVDGVVEIKLIDFEDVYLEGHPIDRSWVEEHRNDPRHNLETYTAGAHGLYHANTATNNFFVKSIRAYLENTKNNYSLSFTDFMRLREPHVVQERDLLKLYHDMTAGLRAASTHSHNLTRRRSTCNSRKHTTRTVRSEIQNVVVRRSYGGRADNGRDQSCAAGRSRRGRGARGRGRGGGGGGRSRRGRGGGDRGRGGAGTGGGRGNS